MVTKAALGGQRVLVTRPLAQSAKLAALIDEAGGEAICFPVIHIEKLPATAWSTHSLEQADWLIFVSRNALESFISGWSKALPSQLKLAAVGDATAEAMRVAGLAVDCQPRSSTGSDGLLQMPEMQAVNGQKMIIVRGEGGRERLADTLKARGASISYMEVYRRNLPSAERRDCIQAMYADKLVCTSAAGIDNLCRLLSEFKAELLFKPLVVVSDRLKQHALAQGFKWVEVSANASDSAVLQTLTEMDRQHGKQR
jgi:uroporphyrinogen-III synthase